jgi:hypothetical protein
MPVVREEDSSRELRPTQSEAKAGRRPSARCVRGPHRVWPKATAPAEPTAWRELSRELRPSRSEGRRHSEVHPFVSFTQAEGRVEGVEPKAEDAVRSEGRRHSEVHPFVSFTQAEGQVEGLEPKAEDAVRSEGRRHSEVHCNPAGVRRSLPLHRPKAEWRELSRKLRTQSEAKAEGTPKCTATPQGFAARCRYIGRRPSGGT